MVKARTIGMILATLLVIGSTVMLAKEASAYSWQWSDDFSEIIITASGNPTGYSADDFEFINRVRLFNGYFIVWVDRNAPQHPDFDEFRTIIEQIEFDYNQEQNEPNYFQYLVELLNRYDLISYLASLKIGEPVTCNYEWNNNVGGYIQICHRA